MILYVSKAEGTLATEGFGAGDIPKYQTIISRIIKENIIFYVKIFWSDD